MITTNLQYFGGRGSAGNSPSTEKAAGGGGNPTLVKSLTDKLNSMKDYESITLGGYDYDTVKKLADQGKEWAEDLLDGAEFSGTYIKQGNQWEEATFSSHPNTYTKKEMLKMIKKATTPIKDTKALRKYHKEVYG